MKTVEEYKTHLIAQLRIVEKGLRIDMSEEASTPERKHIKEHEADTLGAIASSIEDDEELMCTFDIPTCSIIAVRRVRTVDSNPLIADTHRIDDDGKV